MKYLDNPKFAAAQSEFESACFFSRIHVEKCAEYLQKYGHHGADVSGICRNHFPVDVKEELRRYVTAVLYHSERGHAARPKHYQAAAVVHLAREVATLHGSGFYGPQPF